MINGHGDSFKYLIYKHVSPPWWLPYYYDILLLNMDIKHHACKFIRTVGKQNIEMIAYKSFKYTYNPLQTTFSIIIRYVEWFVGWTVVIWCPYLVPSFFAVLLSLHLHLAVFFSSCHVFAAGAYLSWCLPLQSSRSLSSFNKCIFYPIGALIIFLIQQSWVKLYASLLSDHWWHMWTNEENGILPFKVVKSGRVMH